MRKWSGVRNLPIAENVVMRGKGERSEFFIFVSTLPWDKSGVFPGLFD